MITRGIFAVYKPRGVTSAQVTNRIKKILQDHCPIRRLKVGHGGTLDHLAEGILVVAVGSDCRKLTTYLSGTKTYEATGQLGQETDTGDTDGKVVSERPCGHVQQEHVEQVLKSFHGNISQVPPTYSALKREGRRISDLAREGVVITPEPRQVNISDISLIWFRPPHFKISVTCSGGTYIRSLVRDIGHRLDTAAHMIHLCRTRHGAFSLDAALTEVQWTYDCISHSINNLR